MKYQVKQGETRHSVDIDGKHDFSQESPIQVDKKDHQVRIVETDGNGVMKTLMINHCIYRVNVKRRADGFPDEVIIKGIPYKVDIERIESTRYRPPPPAKSIPGLVHANMPGQIISVLAQEGQEVVEGQLVILLEAMKMENEVISPKNGKIKRLAIKQGDLVMKGDVLFEVE
jgi:biotin carboxyl carrier protein